MGEYWKIFSHNNSGKDFDATETEHGTGIQSENEDLRRWLQDLEDDKTAKTGLTTKHLDAFREVVKNNKFSDETAVSPEQIAALKTIAENIKVERDDGTFEKYNTSYLPPEQVESYNPLDAKEFKMSDTGDPNYAYWPYIPSADFFDNMMTVEERDDQQGAKKYKIGEHVKEIREVQKSDQDKPWSCKGF